MALLEIRNLKIYFEVIKGKVRAVDDVSFTLDKGETMGLVGESGCGKTTTAFTVMRLLPYNAEITGGYIIFNNKMVAWGSLALEVSQILEDAEEKEDKEWQGKVAEAMRKREAVLQELKDRIPQELQEDDRETLSGLTELLKQGGEPDDIMFNLQKYLYGQLKGFSGKRRTKKRERMMEEDVRHIRWAEVSMIFQSAMNALNPVHRIGDQIIEALVTHQDISKEDAKKRAVELFKLVGLDSNRVDGYPHEFSGGMRQRAMIAMALACNPQFIIADEPTTALDVIMQDRILAEIRDIQKKLGIAMLIITHDISVVAEVAEKIGIMYAGKLVEHGDIKDIFARPAHPYTMGLMEAFPSIKGARKKLRAIPGSPPNLVTPPSGCRFHPRCRFATERCMQEVPPMIAVASEHFSACIFANELYSGKMGD